MKIQNTNHSIESQLLTSLLEQGRKLDLKLRKLEFAIDNISKNPNNWINETLAIELTGLSKQIMLRKKKQGVLVWRLGSTGKPEYYKNSLDNLKRLN